MYRYPSQFFMEKNGNSTAANKSIKDAFETEYDDKGFFSPSKSHLGMDAFTSSVMEETGFSGAELLECVECAHWAVMDDYACRPVGEKGRSDTYTHPHDEIWLM